MNNARRRIVMQKYHNRAPFDLKKDICNVGKNYKKSFEHVEKSFRTIMNHLEALQSEEDLENHSETRAMAHTSEPRPTVHNSGNTVRPKEANVKNSPQRAVLECFQKATPKRTPAGLKNSPKKVVTKNNDPKPKKVMRNSTTAKEKFSLQTLYRNKNIDFGRNATQHKMMKELLQPNDSMDVDTIDDDFCAYRCDKATSTTDIPQWEDQRVKQPRKPSIKLKTPQKSKSKIPTRKHSVEFDMNSVMRPHKDKPFLDTKIISSPSYICSNCEGTFVLDDDALPDLDGEKYRKSYVETSRTDNRYKPTYNDNSNTNNKTGAKKNTNVKQQKGKPQKNNAKNVNNKNYLGIINTTKVTKCHKMEVGTENNTTDTNNDSSNEPSETEFVPQVKGSKKSRYAIDTNRPVLAKYMKKAEELNQTPLTKCLKRPEELMHMPVAKYMRSLDETTRTCLGKYIKAAEEASQAPLAKYMKPAEESNRTPLAKYMRPTEELTIQPAISFNRVDVANTRMSRSRKTSPYTISKKMDSMPCSKESGIIGDQNFNSGKRTSYGRSDSRPTRKVQKPRGVK